MSAIHPSAIIEEGAQIGDGVTIGPYCCIGPNVSLADNVELKSHVVIDGRTSIGEGTRIFPFASLGHEPQDLKYDGENSVVEIGARTTIREYVTVHPGTDGGGGNTKIGDDCLLMGSVHVAHDCIIGNNVILAQATVLGGHVIIDDFAILGGSVGVHQFVRIGAHAMIGGMSAVDHDVIPFGSVSGERAVLGGLNIIGMKRRGMNREEISALRSAFGHLFTDQGTLQDRVAEVADQFGSSEAVMSVVEFMQADTSRAFCQPKPGD